MEFLNLTKSLTTTENILFKATKNTIIISGTIANKTKNEEGFVNLFIKKSSENYAIFTNIPLPFGSSLNIPKFILTPNDEITSFCSLNLENNCDLILSIVEMD